MATERTFSILKPDATARNLTGAINAVIEKAGLRIIAQKRIHMSKAQAVVVQVLEGDNAIAKYRAIMGATDPSKAADGTIRKLFAKSVGENSVHGSDAADTAALEIAQFFSGNEIVG